MKNYKYELQKGSKRYICPKCGKKTFKVFVYTGTNIVVDSEKFGRCNRENNCGYFRYPDRDIKYDYNYMPPAPQPSKQPDFVPDEIVESTFHRFKENIFFMYLVKLFGMNEAYRLQEMYNIGTAKGGGTIFWQQDKEGNFRTGKVMYYRSDGHRDKNRSSWYVHKQVKKDFELQQVFFGEHLVTEDKPIALCESEKTAILMSMFEPSYTWLAAGGSEMINAYRLNRLPRLDLVCPDDGQFEKWQEKTKIFSGRQMDVSVSKAVKEGLLEKGADIADLKLIEREIEKKRLKCLKHITEGLYPSTAEEAFIFVDTAKKMANDVLNKIQ
jgi:hypothetical protein